MLLKRSIRFSRVLVYRGPWLGSLRKRVPDYFGDLKIGTLIERTTRTIPHLNATSSAKQKGLGCWGVGDVAYAVKVVVFGLGDRRF